MERNFKEDVYINKYKLHDDCVEQASLYHYYSELLAEAKGEKDEKADFLKLVSAEKDLHYRANGLPNGIKATVDAMRATLAQDPDVLKAEKELRDAKKSVYELESYVNAIEHRKSMLKNLVQLYSVNYYSIPDGRKETTEDVAQRELRKNLNRKGE